MLQLLEELGHEPDKVSSITIDNVAIRVEYIHPIITDAPMWDDPVSILTDPEPKRPA